MAQKLVLHKDGLLTGTCRTSLSPKGGSAETARAQRPAEGPF